MTAGFRIAARALRQLGAELITSDDVALNELIKNAFDAKSPRVKVYIYAPLDSSSVELIVEKLASQHSIQKSQAREEFSKAFDKELVITAKDNLLYEFDRHASSKEELIAYLRDLRVNQYFIRVEDTGNGMSKDDLSNSFLVIGTPNKFLLKKENESINLLGEKGVGRLSMMRLGRLSTVDSKTTGQTNWYKINFDWSLFDDPNLFLEDISIPVVVGETAAPEAKGTTIVIKELYANWNGSKVNSFINKYIRRLQNPFKESSSPFPIDILFNEKRQVIRTLPAWLKEQSQFEADFVFSPAGIDGTDKVLRRKIKWKGSDSWDTRSWTMSELTTSLETPQSTFDSLGPLTGHCLWFNRSKFTHNVDHSIAEIRDELNLWCGGFGIYRDGFRIGMSGGMDDDWLEWDSAALKSQGFSLNRYQTVGTIEITSKHNPYLVDAANREKLVACPEQKLLIDLFGKTLREDLKGRIAIVFDAQVKAEINEESTEVSIKKSENSLKDAMKNLKDISRIIPPEDKPRFELVQSSIKDQIEYLGAVKKALTLAKETKVELLELANIGLVVEIVVHELARLTSKTGELLMELKRGNKPIDAVSIIDNLQSQIKATNKRIRTVDAMSPSGRHRKEEYDAVKQIHQVVNGYKDRFRRHEIQCEVILDDAEEDKPLIVNMVKGLIAQSLENLLSNSVYWVQQDLKAGETQRSIRIEIDSQAKSIIYSDNGPGIDPVNRKEIFTPYFSTRKKGKGLGLYITKELVEYHGGKIYLDDTPEKDGRIRTFVIELPKE